VSSKVVQNVTTDISKTETVLNTTKKYLKHHCSQEALEGTIKEAAITVGLDWTNFSTYTIHPSSHLLLWRSCDPIHDPKERFKVECFYCIVDAAVTSIKEIFQLPHGYGNTPKCLYNARNSENEFSEEDLMQYCQDLQLTLSFDNTAKTRHSRNLQWTDCATWADKS